VPNFSLRLRLALLVAGTTLPLILFAGGVIYLHHANEWQAASLRVLQTVRSMRLVLDREMQGIQSGLQVLALSPRLQRGDLDGFRSEVEAFRLQYSPYMSLSLADETGAQLLNTNAVPGANLPPRGSTETIQRVIQTGRPAFSRVFKGNLSARLLLSIDVPVYLDGRLAYALGASVPFENFQAIIQQQRPNDQWTVAIFDQAGVNIARVPNPEQTLGRSASPTLLAALLKTDEAQLITFSLEGTELITAFTRSPISGWTVAAGIPTNLITGPLWRNLAVTAAIGAVMLAIGLAFALRMASRIARAETLHKLLINELNHRVKNTLATVQSVALQTFRGVPGASEQTAKFDARLVALGRAHNVLSEQKWENANVREIVSGVVDSFATSDSGRIHISGPEVHVTPKCALMTSMVLHELATNAVKYGALSNDKGEVFVDWDWIDGKPPKLRVRWRETGGPAVKPPDRKGFGSRLIEQSFAAQLGGSATLAFDATGLVCTLESPVDGADEALIDPSADRPASPRRWGAGVFLLTVALAALASPALAQQRCPPNSQAAAVAIPGNLRTAQCFCNPGFRPVSGVCAPLKPGTPDLPPTHPGKIVAPIR
jgi:two-component sensor histidine kinase